MSGGARRLSNTGEPEIRQAGFADRQCTRGGHPSRECERSRIGRVIGVLRSGVSGMDMDRPSPAERISAGSARPVVLITGASSGIGTALAEVFAENGHEVVLLARRVLQLTAIAEKIEAAGHARPHILPADLSRPDATERIAAELTA